MSTCRALLVLAMVAAMELAGGCAASKVSFSDIQRPDRAPELAAYDSFVGSWTWDAKMVYPEGLSEAWTGTADWNCTFAKRCLKGDMSAKSDHAEFESAGVWSRHPKSGKYIWWMFNNWGYPQEGTATYNEESGFWCMKYKSVGLDGTDSYGCYCITTVDKDTLDWKMVEWADAFHTIKKIEMEGTYKRQK